MDRRKTRILPGMMLVFFLFSGCSAGVEKETEKSVEAFVTERTTEETATEETTIEETTAEETVQETTAEQQEQEVSFLFAGDICLEENGFVLDYYDQMGQ